MSDSPHAQLEWDAQGQPLSRQFGDVYFSREDGLGETHHVFLDGNDLPARFAALPPGGRLVIGETGFGTGLNFLCAWQLFDQLAPATARLHFVSVEKYPLTADDLRQALALWPSLERPARALLEQYRAIHPGFQRLLFDGGRVVLTLLIGDVLEQLPALDAEVDAWFLDGFAPARNPQMWTPALFAQLARLSAPGATLGTFTSAGAVRRGLIEAGFQMRRVPGFGRKREILRGHYEGPPAPPVAPWYARPTAAASRQAVVIGGGLAGCATAASLAARGWQVSLIERHDELAREGSGNPQGVLYLKLSAHGTALSRLVVAGFGHTRRLLERLGPPADGAACGVLQLAFDAREAARQAALAAAFPSDLLRAVAREEAERLAGVGLPSGGLYFPDAGWLHPPALCRWLGSQPGITRRVSQEALHLRRTAGGWQVLGAGDRPLAEAPVVVLANAADACALLPQARLPLKRIRGQISRLPATPASAALRTVLCAEGYVAPPRGGEHTLGASFDFHADHLQPTPEEHRDNLRMLAQLSPDLLERLGEAAHHPDTLQGRAAYRCTSPDYLPLVGPLADPEAFENAYGMLRRDARLRPDTPCPWLEGLHLNLAHGSRGLLTAPLAGELLAAWLENEPLPVPREVAEACHPNRFALRRVIRGER